jgi:arylsulfatase
LHEPQKVAFIIYESLENLSLLLYLRRVLHLKLIYVFPLKDLSMLKQPNVLLITTDHWPASLLGCAGDPIVRTPTLDNLAECGTRFKNAYSECPVCIPARRTLMTGMSPKAHGDRTFQTELTMPNAATLAETFHDNGYQTYAVGKLHVYPQRDRIGFDDVLLCEEGRVNYGVIDDYEMFLADQGYPGQQFMHGMSNNQYTSRPWHLPEHCHVTNWTTQQMCRMIQRRDPTKPALWYASYTHPHPPIAPLQSYTDMYRDVDWPDLPVPAWFESDEKLPPTLQKIKQRWGTIEGHAYKDAMIGFYALCTHIDHQIRLIIGQLREAGELDNTMIIFTSDHGDMLGQHGLWAKRLFYEGSTNVPMIVVGPKGNNKIKENHVSDRLVCLADVMPTICEVAELVKPASADGRPMIGANERTHLYGEYGEGIEATRMVRDDRFKLIYYPVGNQTQLFDLENDPKELVNLSNDSAHQGVLSELTDLLTESLYGNDLSWIKDGQLVGLPDEVVTTSGDRGLFLQRGSHFPPPKQY